MRKNSLLGGALILTIAGFITRILGFIYRIYISNLIGSEGMGLFQLIYPIFMLSHTICCSGTFIAISKIVAEESAKRELGNMRKTFRIATCISLFISLIFVAILYFFSSFIGQYILNDTRTSMAIKILAFAIPFSILNSCFKAYFYGTKSMIVPATSQVIEQVTRMGIIFILAGFFIPRGLEYACAMTVIGTAVGELISFMHVYLNYKRGDKKTSHYNKKPTKRLVKILPAIFSISVPLTLSRTITTLLASYESIIIPTKLITSGLSKQAAMSLYGELTGMAMPLIFFPSLLTNALSMALLPTVSEASAINNNKKICYTVSKALQFTSLIGLGSTCLFLTFSHQLGIVVYNQENVGNLLFSLAFICPFIYLQSTFGGILNGLGLQNTAFRNNLIGLSIRITVIVFLVPIYGINIFLVGLLISVVIVSLLNLFKILKVIVLKLNIMKYFVQPLLASFATGFVTYYISNHFLYPNFTLRLALIIGLLLLCVLYVIFNFLLGSITLHDIRVIKKSL